MPPAGDFWGLAGQMAVEVGLGLAIGFASRMVFFMLEIAGSIISTEMGISMPPGINPLNDTPMAAPATMLYYLAAMLWLSLDMHHWMLIGFSENLHLSAHRRGPSFPGAGHGHRRAHRRHFRPRPATGGPAAGRLVHHFPGLLRPGPGRAADERLCRELRRPSAGRPECFRADAGFDVRAHHELPAAFAGGHAAGGPTAALTGAAHDDQTGEKTEKPTPKRLEDALNKGQIARSPEVQTVFVLGAAMLALGFTGGETWRIMAETPASMFGHLHDTP